MVETSIVLSATLMLILASIDLTIALVRQNALREGARRAARFLAVRGNSANQLGSQGSAMLYTNVAANHVLAAQLRPYLSTMSPADVKLVAEWMDGDNEPDDRVRVTLQYTHRPLFAAMLPNYGQQLFWASSTVRIGH